mmetsp:Transcript_14735/g.20851  ORF Transcript_14735/g.20851 Transcript_14735/m.20851 type:complete len:117 (-) Transcript_14735:962-1312(-)
MAIKQLFHFREAGQDDLSTFSSAALFLFFVPYVDTASQGTLYGTASRLMLCTLLQRRAFGSPDVLLEYDGCGSLGPKRLSPLVQWDTIVRAYPCYPTIDDVEMRPGDENCWLDLIL